MNSNDELVGAVASLADLMKQASYSKAASLLRDFTYSEHGKELIAKQQCVTRWTGTMDMIERYFRIKSELEKIKELRQFFLSKQDDRTLTQAGRSFTMLKIVTKELQHKGITLLEVRDLFDAVLEDDRFTDAFERTIGEDSTLIKNPAFESGILRLTADPNTTLQSREAEACKKLLIPTAQEEEADENEEPMSLQQKLEQRAQKRKESSKKPVATGRYYDPSKFICATSNCCERLFSEAKYILVPHRSAMSPILFEALLFLKKNKRFWCLDLVSKAMKTEPTADQMMRDDDCFYN
jgi:hypothetical protein